MDQIDFTLTEEHLKLLKQMRVSWQDVEFGAPEIDPKRPYGNSQVYYDIAEHLGYEIPPDDEDFSEEMKRRMWKLHRETETALQILLQMGACELGTYTADKYQRDWKRK